MFKLLFFLLSISFTLFAEERFTLPENHPMRPVLDRLFRDPNVLRNHKTFFKAGFSILHERPSTMIVAAHPRLPGYLVKLYLNSSKKKDREGVLQNFVNRCLGAENVRRVIQEENIRYFVVADKWLYYPTPPNYPVLLVTDMKTRPREESRIAWKTIITRQHLKEVFEIVKHGYASTSFPSNIPYTKNEIFAFVDTECPCRQPLYDHGRAHLSEKMQLYWDELVAELHAEQQEVVVCKELQVE